MPHITGLRGVLPEPSRVAEVSGGPLDRPLDLGAGLAAGTLVQDAGRAVYRYHQSFAGPGRTFTRKSLVCAVRLATWDEGVIRPHEATTPDARAAALATIHANRAHTEPVLFGIRDAASEIDRLFRKAESARPTLELTTADGTTHRLWRVQDAELIGKLRGYFAPKKLHLLDGHDRYEAMLAYRDELAAQHGLATYSSANYALAVLVPMDDPALVVAARHRVVRGGAAEPAAVLAAARPHFIVEKLPGAAGDVGKLGAALADTLAHQPAFVAVFAGAPDAWKLTLSPDVSPVAEGVQVHRALQKLDPIVVEHLFIERCLKGARVTSETDAQRALAALGAGADLVLIMRPLSIAQIAHVDELGQRLPPQSTAFHPAIAPGLVSLVIDPDEDLV